MPFMNAGTLLENIVLVDCCRLLMEDGGDGPIDFASSFAMPPLSPWVPHKCDANFSRDMLDKLSAEKPSVPAGEYPSLLRACLGHDSTCGPNGALLVAMLAVVTNRRVRFWLNDIEEGRYGNAIPQLKRINRIAIEILGEKTQAQVDDPAVTSRPYDDSLAHLEHMLKDWAREGPPSARLGYLDPWWYRIERTERNETSVADHRRWLRILAEGNDGPTLSVHFTANEDREQLRRELAQMYADGIGAGYQKTVAFRCDYYGVSVNVRCPVSTFDVDTIVSEVTNRVASSWKRWHEIIGSDEIELEVISV